METMLREGLNGDFESGTFNLVMLFGFEGSRLRQLVIFKLIAPDGCKEGQASDGR